MLRIITINEEGGFNMEITNKSIKTGEEQESQTIEWKWTWHSDFNTLAVLIIFPIHSV